MTDAEKLEFTQEWYSTRWQRLIDELKDTDVWPRVACIMANGTADPYEPPTYARQLNALRYENAQLRKELGR